MPTSPRPARILAAAALAALAAAAFVAGCDFGGATLADEGPSRPTTLRFSMEPEYAVAGGLIGPGVAVTVFDNFGDTVFSSTASIRLSIAPGTGSPSAHLNGTTQLAAVNGTAQFSNLSIDSPGTGYRLLALSDPLGGALSDSFNVTAPAPAPGPAGRSSAAARHPRS